MSHFFWGSPQFCGYPQFWGSPQCLDKYEKKFDLWQLKIYCFNLHLRWLLIWILYLSVDRFTRPSFHEDGALKGAHDYNVKPLSQVLLPPLFALQFLQWKGRGKTFRHRTFTLGLPKYWPSEGQRVPSRFWHQWEICGASHSSQHILNAVFKLCCVRPPITL